LQSTPCGPNPGTHRFRRAVYLINTKTSELSLQAIVSELVSQLNTANRVTATTDDLNAAVEMTLVSSQAYFHYVWTDECSDEEREVLAGLALGEDVGQDQRRPALQSLLRKEIVEKDQNGYRLSVEMFRFWILRNGAASGSGRVS
jgi:hypothetical protein